MAIFWWGSPNGGIEWRWGMNIPLFSTIISLHCVLSMLKLVNAVDTYFLCVINTVPPLWQAVTLIAGRSKRRSLLIAGDDDKVFMTRILNIVLFNIMTAFNCMPWWISNQRKSLIVEEYAQHDVLLKLTADRHEALHGLSVTAELLELFTDKKK